MPPPDPLELASALQAAGRLAEAEPLYRAAIARDPDLWVAHNNLVVLLRAQDRWDEAIEEMRIVQRLRPQDPVLEYRLGSMLLAAGQYAEGWPLYEARRRVSTASEVPPLPMPEWTGGAVASLLVWSEQGFGDMIMYARFLAPLRARGVALTLACPPALMRLMAPLGVPLVAAEQAGTVMADAWVLAGSLPLRLGATLETLPAAPYLQAAPRRSGGIGVAWRGNPAHVNDRNRSLPGELAGELLALPGAIDLDPAATGAQDFQDTAEIVAGLDHVIAVDTATAHLAAALGRPLALLLPWRNTDWRWLRRRTDSPWYPSARLYRQPTDGDWRTPLDQLRRDLAV